MRADHEFLPDYKLSDFFKPEFTGLSQINKKCNHKYCLTEMRGR